MTDEELKQLVESNARAIQAMLDARAEERQESQQRMDGLQDVLVRLTDLQAGMAQMLASLDEDRPTILRKSTSIENKVDQLLEQPSKDGESEGY
ncbi:hypothetical protein K9N68_21100 [Kovacikia minuta CCNUW1]|uniref:hypothetical protein n=1 Tax=Kovacikia minuta TaxID=2931930 RepID=UPI001CCCC69A|nr:hypothetical protein [Kovacikia minuta]UBF24203.1 hypothetical protein K9N68_21100 [Kovacikia minuta CCNUW1]